MGGETDLSSLISGMKPELNQGEYVFCVVDDPHVVSTDSIIGSFKEKEGLTVILEKQQADTLKLDYDFTAAWITLTIHSSLQAVGLTAAFSKALAEQSISCNVIAGYYHDHIFVDQKDASKAMKALQEMVQHASKKG